MHFTRAVILYHDENTTVSFAAQMYGVHDAHEGQHRTFFKVHTSYQ